MKVFKYIVIIVLLVIAVLIERELRLLKTIRYLIFPPIIPPTGKEELICQRDEDCVFLPERCDSCSCEVYGINKKFFEKYNNKCLEYHGPVCDMLCPKREISCVDGYCLVN